MCIKEKLDLNDKTLVEKKISEHLIQHIAFQLSDMVIVVINEITWPDQEYIEILRCKLLASNKHNKTLYIVHNYLDITVEEELFYMWKSNIVSLFYGNVVQQPIGKETAIYFRQGGANNQLPTFHFFLAKEGSKAGDIWNPLTYSLLTQMILSNNVANKGSLSNDICNAIKDGLRHFTRNPSDPEFIWDPALKSVQNNTSSSFSPKTTLGRIDLEEWIQCTPINDPPSVSQLFIQCPGDLTLTTTVDITGFSLLCVPSNSPPPSYEAPYDYCITAKGLLVMVDLPGVDEKQIEVKIEHDLMTYVIISGTRKLSYLDYEKKEENKGENKEEVSVPVLDSEDYRRLLIGKHEMQRKQGRFEIKLHIPATIENDESFHNLKDGVFEIFFPKKPEPKKFTFPRKEERDFTPTRRKVSG